MPAMFAELLANTARSPCVQASQVQLRERFSAAAWHSKMLAMADSPA